jgi:hypothetical protein
MCVRFCWFQLLLLLIASHLRGQIKTILKATLVSFSADNGFTLCRSTFGREESRSNLMLELA